MLRAGGGGGGAGPVLAFRSGIEFIFPPSGSMANNGAFTLGANLQYTPINAYMFFPAAAISVGSPAGWFFCTFSGSTTGTVFNNIYTTGLPTIPSPPTPFVTTGPGAFTASVATNFLMQRFTVPGGTMTPNGFIYFYAYFTKNGIGANIALNWQSVTTGGAIAQSQSITSTSCSQASVYLQNRGALNSNILCSAAGPYAGGATFTVGQQVLAINTAVSQDYAVYTPSTLTVATDSFSVELIVMEVYA